MSAVAVPIYDFSGQVRAILTALGISTAVDPSAKGPLARDLLRRAREISAKLGYRPGPAASSA